MGGRGQNSNSNHSKQGYKLIQSPPFPFFGKPCYTCPHRPHRLEVRTLPFQGSNAGSIPAGGTRPRRVELGMNRYQFALRIQMEQE